MNHQEKQGEKLKLRKDSQTYLTIEPFCFSLGNFSLRTAIWSQSWGLKCMVALTQWCSLYFLHPGPSQTPSAPPCSHISPFSKHDFMGLPAILFSLYYSGAALWTLTKESKKKVPFFVNNKRKPYQLIMQIFCCMFDNKISIPKHYKIATFIAETVTKRVVK